METEIGARTLQTLEQEIHKKGQVFAWVTRLEFYNRHYYRYRSWNISEKLLYIYINEIYVIQIN